MTDPKIERAFTALRIGLGTTALLAGADKFTDLLVDWDKYLNPAVARAVGAKRFMRAVGIIEMAVGTMILTKSQRVGGWVASAWLAAIAANLVSTGKYFDIAVRDLNMSVAALVMAALAEVREESKAPSKRMRVIRDLAA